MEWVLFFGAGFIVSFCKRESSRSKLNSELQNGRPLHTQVLNLKNTDFILGCSSDSVLNAIHRILL